MANHEGHMFYIDPNGRELSKLCPLPQNTGETLLDTFEKLILKVLQRDGRASTQALSDAVGLSPSPCWRRVKRLEDDGYITRYAAILDGKKLGLNALAQAARIGSGCSHWLGLCTLARAGSGCN